MILTWQTLYIPAPFRLLFGVRLCNISWCSIKTAAQQIELLTYRLLSTHPTLCYSNNLQKIIRVFLNLKLRKNCIVCCEMICDGLLQVPLDHRDHAVICSLFLHFMASSCWTLPNTCFQSVCCMFLFTIYEWKVVYVMVKWDIKYNIELHCNWHNPSTISRFPIV